MIDCIHVFNGLCYDDGDRCVKCGTTRLQYRLSMRMVRIDHSWGAAWGEGVQEDHRLPFELDNCGTVRQSGRVVAGLTRDELLMTVVRLTYGKETLPERTEPEPVACDGWSLRVVPVERRLWTVETVDGSKFSPLLDDGALIGWFASRIFGGKPLYGGLQSYEEFVRGREWLRRNPSGSIECGAKLEEIS